MKHFVVVEDYDYEGRPVQGVFTSVDDALEFIKNPPAWKSKMYFPEIDVWENGEQFSGLDYKEVQAQIGKPHTL